MGYQIRPSRTAQARAEVAELYRLWQSDVPGSIVVRALPHSRTPGDSEAACYFCVGCQQVHDGAPTVAVHDFPICSEDCFERVCESHRMIDETPPPVPLWYYMLAMVFIVLTVWGMTIWPE